MTTEKNKAKKQNLVDKKMLRCSFSIVIANYNYADHVAQAIQSSLGQDYPQHFFEVIVVDDGSTDNSRKVIAELASKNKNLRVVHQNNLGQAAAFYAGINLANYEWVCFLDSDDYFKPQKLSVLNDYIHSLAGDCEFICHDVDAVDEVAGKVQSWFGRQQIKSDSLSVNEALGGYPYANPCGQVYKKTLLQKIAPWINTAEWMRGADNPLVWGGLFVSGRVYYLHQSLAVYRIHANNFFLASTPKGLVPKVNWLERWPKLLAYLRYLNQGAASCFRPGGNRDNLLLRLDQFYQIWDRKLSLKPGVPILTLITICKNRLEHLKQSLPQMVKQPNTQVVVVDYGCSQGTRDWVKAHYPQVTIVAVDDDPGWCAARARNLGAKQAQSDWLCFIDADIVLQGNLTAWVVQHAQKGFYYIADSRKFPTAYGTVVCSRTDYLNSGGYDEACRNWFPEDSIFYDALQQVGCTELNYPGNLILPIRHGDELRALGGEGQFDTRRQAIRSGLLYRTIKNDLASFSNHLNLRERQHLIQFLKDKVKVYESSLKKNDARVVIDANKGLSQHQAVNLDRKIIYTFRNERHITKHQLEDILKNQSNLN